MGWRANDGEEREKAQYVQCSTCDYCRSIGRGRNICAKREGATFGTNTPQMCKQHSSVEWREDDIEKLKKEERSG